MTNNVTKKRFLALAGLLVAATAAVGCTGALASANLEGRSYQAQIVRLAEPPPPDFSIVIGVDAPSDRYVEPTEPTDPTGEPPSTVVTSPMDEVPAELGEIPAVKIASYRACGDSEYVDIANQSAAPADLAGWYIRDSTDLNGNRLNITEYELAAGQRLRIYVGEAPAGDVHALGIGKSSRILNDGGDTIRLFATGDRLADIFEYEECEGERILGGAGGDPVTETATITPTMPGESADVIVRSISACGREFVTLLNTGDALVNLNGWALHRAAGNRRFELRSINLPPDESVRIYTKMIYESDRGAKSALLREANIWSNRGGTVGIQTPGGELVNSFVYEGCGGVSPDAPEVPLVRDDSKLGILCVQHRGGARDEYVVLVNRNEGDAEIDLHYWYIGERFDSNVYFELPSIILARGETVRVYTGMESGLGSPNVHMGWTQGVWSDGGVNRNEVELYNPNGSLIAHVSYPAPTATHPDCVVSTGGGGTTGGGGGGTTQTPPMLPPNSAQVGDLALMCVHLQDEYVVLTSSASGQVNLQSWYIQDMPSASGRSNKITLPSYELAAGGMVRVYTRAPAAGVSDPYVVADGRANVWNNGGDEATLFAPDGTEAGMTAAECGQNQPPTGPMGPPTGPMGPTGPMNPDMTMMGGGNPTTTPTQTGEVQVMCIHLRDEYVVLRNTGADAVDLQGWQIKDAADNEVNVPSYDLAAGAAVRVYTRMPAGISDPYVVASGRANVWNNGGDTARLFSPDGSEVAMTSTECS